MAVVSVELNNGEVVQMTTSVLAYLIRRRKRQLDRMDAEPDSWITLENGEHVPLDANGNAIGGAGGWAKGKNFKSASKVEKNSLPNRQAKIEVSPELKPKNNDYKFSMDYGVDEFIRANAGNSRKPTSLFTLFHEVENSGGDGMEAVKDEFYRLRLAECTKDFKELPRDEINQILADNLRPGTVQAWFREYNHEVRDSLIWQMTQSPEVHNAALNMMYLNYKSRCKIENTEPLPFNEFLITPIKMYRGGSGKEHATAALFSSYTLDKKVADMFTDSEVGTTYRSKPSTGVIYEGEIRPIDTYGSINTSGESEILVPRGIAPNGNRDSADDDYREDEEPDSWITVNGNHIPLNKAGNPIGGQPKALGKGTGQSKKEVENNEPPSSRLKTVSQANKRLKEIIDNGKADDPQTTKDIIEVFRSSDVGTKIKMPESWADEGEKPPVYERDEEGFWTDKKYGGSMSNEDMAYYFLSGIDDPNEMPKVSKYVPNEKYIPTDDIQWKDPEARVSESDVDDRISEIMDDEMSEAYDRAHAGLYDGQAQFFGSYMNGVSYKQESHEAFNSYNLYGDSLINGMCRGSEPKSESQSREWSENKEQTKKYIEQMTDACDKNPLRKDAIVFRGIKTPSAVMKALGLSLPSGTNLYDLYEDKDFVRSLVGRTFSDPAFTSTSIDEDFPDRGGFANAAKMEICCPKGTKGVYCGDALKITDEHEYILQRGTQYMIMSAYVTTPIYGKHPRLYLRVAVIGQEPQEIPELKTYKGEA